MAGSSSVPAMRSSMLSPHDPQTWDAHALSNFLGGSPMGAVPVLLRAAVDALRRPHERLTLYFVEFFTSQGLAGRGARRAELLALCVERREPRSVRGEVGEAALGDLGAS